jgi:hypothetical protein
VKQLAFENDGGRELVREYRIARFLEMNVPSFVAGPFGLMRGVTSSSADYEEKLSFIQQPIHGKTLKSIGKGEFTILELCSMFLQCNEFYLRVGGSLKMEDVNTGNVMVDVRMPGDPRVKFIDFGCWYDKDSTNYITDSSSYGVMMNNIYWEGHPMKKLMSLMGFEIDDFLTLYQGFRDNCDQIDVLLELPSQIARLFSRIPDCDVEEVVGSPQFRVVEKLCKFRYDQKKAGRPIGIINESSLGQILVIFDHHY